MGKILAAWEKAGLNIRMRLWIDSMVDGQPFHYLGLRILCAKKTKDKLSYLYEIIYGQVLCISEGCAISILIQVRCHVYD